MRLIQFYKLGFVKVDKVTKSYDFYETDDGYHVIPPDAVYRDREMKLPAISILMDGLITAVGSKQTESLINRVWMNMDMNKDTNNRPSVSTSFSRWLAELFGKLVKYLPIIVVILILAYGLLTSMSQPVVQNP